MKIIILICLFIIKLFSSDFEKGLEAYRKHDYTLAFSLWKPLAENNNTEAQFKLGTLYRYGEGVQKNNKESEYWFSKAFTLNSQNACKVKLLSFCQDGSIEAQYGLGEAYFLGGGVKRDWNEARYWYKLAAERGHPRSQCKLGWFYEHGTMGQFLNRSYTGLQSYEEAYKWYKKAAEQGDAEAQKNLGYFYLKGKGTQQSDQKSFYWYEQSAKQYYSDSYFNMAFAYLKGTGVDQDFNKSAYWYEMSEKFGHNLATGKAKLIRKELVARKQHAEQGDPQAQYELGMIYQNINYHNLDVPRDPEKAFYWYQKAAKQNYAPAQNKLGYMYRYGKERGQWVDQDSNKSLYWYNKAAKQNYTPSIHEIGNIYYHGEGVQKDSQKAFYWYQKAAEQNYAPSQFVLGFFYYYGEGVQKDSQKALFWYKKAAEQNDRGAIRALKNRQF